VSNTAATTNGPAATGSTSNSTVRSAGAAASAPPSPSTSPATIGRAASTTTTRTFSPARAPSAVRIAISRRRIATPNDVTAYTPAAASTSAMTANAPTSLRFRRRGASAASSASSIVFMADAGTSGSTSLSARRNASRASDGSPLVRRPQYMLLVSHCTVGSGTCGIGT
jgi:hypothetical protein